MYIERAKAIHAVEKKLNDARENCLFQVTNYLSIAKALLRAIPAADVAPVVRCKECKEWGARKAPQQQDKFGFCACNLMDTHSDFFCAYGERYPTGGSNYCPNCGAKMDGGKENVQET